MLSSGPQEPDPTPSEPASAVLVRVIRGKVRESEKRFTATFVVGRSKECDFQILETTASRCHLQVICDGARWRLKDLGSANGTFLDGVKIEDAPLPDHATIELGKGGALLSLTVEGRDLPKTEKLAAAMQEFTTETQIIQHYLDSSRKEHVGEQRGTSYQLRTRDCAFDVVNGECVLWKKAAGVRYTKNALVAMRARELFTS